MAANEFYKVCKRMHDQLIKNKPILWDQHASFNDALKMDFKNFVDYWNKHEQDVLALQSAGAGHVTGRDASNYTTRTRGGEKEPGYSNEAIHEQYSKAVTELNEKIKQLQKRNYELKEYISENLNAKISSDETVFENLNDPLRPMLVVESFERLAATDWLDAKDELDRIWRGESDTERTKALADIPVKASQKALQIKEQIFSNIKRILDPTSQQQGGTFGQSENPQKGHSALPDDLKVAICKHLKTTPVQSYQQEILQAVNNVIPVRYHSGINQQYTNACAHIAWQMAIQLPPMEIVGCDQRGELFDPKKHELVFNSPAAASNSIVRFYVFPRVQHGHVSMSRAKVTLK